MKLLEYLKLVRLCLTCIALAACAGQMLTVPTEASHPANAVSPPELDTVAGRTAP